MIITENEFRTILDTVLADKVTLPNSILDVYASILFGEFFEIDSEPLDVIIEKGNDYGLSDDIFFDDEAEQFLATENVDPLLSFIQANGITIENTDNKRQYVYSLFDSLHTILASQIASIYKEKASDDLC